MTREQAEEMVNRYGRSCMLMEQGKGSLRDHFIFRNDLISALASPPAPAEGALTREGKGVVQAAGTPSRSVLLCLSCGALPPHEGCEALCPACAPPNGTCRCPGCSLVAPAPAEGAREAERLAKALEGMLTIYEKIVDEGEDFGMFAHAEDCPEDDSCECPLLVACNSAERRARKVLQDRSDRLRSAPRPPSSPPVEVRTVHGVTVVVGGPPSSPDPARCQAESGVGDRCSRPFGHKGQHKARDEGADEDYYWPTGPEEDVPAPSPAAVEARCRCGLVAFAQPGAPPWAGHSVDGCVRAAPSPAAVEAPCQHTRVATAAGHTFCRECGAQLAQPQTKEGAP